VRRVVCTESSGFRSGQQQQLWRMCCARWTLYMNGILIVLDPSAIANRIYTHITYQLSRPVVSSSVVPRSSFPSSARGAMSIDASTYIEVVEKLRARECRMRPSAALVSDSQLDLCSNFSRCCLMFFNLTAPTLSPTSRTVMSCWSFSGAQKN
jgi:hypothetical protein